MRSKTRWTQLFVTGAGEIDVTGDGEGNEGTTVGPGGRDAVRGAIVHAANMTTANTGSFFIADIDRLKDTLVPVSVPETRPFGHLEVVLR